MNYNEALEFIHSVSNYFCKPGLTRIKYLCSALGNPQDSLRFVHIAGTNGKGSACAFLSGILKNVGYTVGTYSSPYILRFNERISVNGESISDTDLSEICQKIKFICEQMEDKPTEFEVITAIAFEYFKKRNCDIVVLECGLGGRLDATNIIKNPLLSVITGIDFDHQNFLGDTIELIAAEKSGIIKEGRPVLWCGDNKNALEVIRREANSKGCDLYINDKEIEIISADLSGTVFNYDGFKNLKISLLGSYQPKNAANAVAAAQILKNQGLNIPDNAIFEGLENTKWPARFEKLNEAPLIIFDGSHNPQGVTATVQSIRQYFGDKKVNILSGVMKDKDYTFIAKAIGRTANKVYCVTVNNPRSLKAEDYRKVFTQNSVNAESFDKIDIALNAAIENSLENNIPLICMGSLYMYSDIYKILKGQ